MGEQGGPDFKYGLFDCFGNCKLCAVTYFCPCYVLGKTGEKSGAGSCVLCGAATLFGITTVIGIMQTREKVREQKGIPGSTGNDCLMSLFCPLCTLIQSAREIEAEVPGIPEVERA